MKKYTCILLSFLLPMLITGCSNSNKALMDTPMNSTEIDKIIVITSMGNPKYGADSKNIVDTEEIGWFVKSFNSAILGKKVKSEDVGVAMPSHYNFYSKSKLIASFAFNGNNSQIIWHDNDYYYIEYGVDFLPPYELYQKSAAKIEVIDEVGNTINRSSN